MGITSSKVNTKTNDNYNLYNEEQINVHFVQLAKLPGCNITPDQLNALLGLNIPRYYIFEGAEYPYVFCVSTMVDIYKIANEYGYTVGFMTRQKVFKHEFNASYQAAFSICGNNYYKLEPIR